jgi:hypothetical protein
MRRKIVAGVPLVLLLGAAAGLHRIIKPVPA